MARRGPLCAAVMVTAVACAAVAAGPERRAAKRNMGRSIRVAVATAASRPEIGGNGDWKLMERDAQSVLVRGNERSQWNVEVRASRMRAVKPDGTPTAWREGPLLLRPVSEGDFIIVNGKSYRGEMWLTARPNDLVLVVNVLPVEAYLRGVVPLEIGTQRTDAEFAAVAAQAIAARTYTYSKLPLTKGRPYDLASTVDDQVYGGVQGERPLSDRAIATTRGMVLRYGGRLAQAPYSATCGGRTAAQPEVWTNREDEPYLQRVSDLIPGSDHYYCEIGPKFSWTRTFSQQDLILTLEKYMRGYAKVSTGSVGAPRLIAVDKLTPSGRVATLTIVTDRDRYLLHGNDIRFVLRTTGGEILNSTYFSVESDVGRDGRLSRVTFTGRGNGHGIGMCQWGAIGRARAGQDFRTILRTYYPGTTIGQVD